ncbi:Thioredoxin domain-containing protein [Emticicia oligotrophica DSM 17448]|uniref:Thioredoxin domain-containing protein n=1 Tax=Emticicia oligotrophica (strain DSM 17448 / CIP 109782 / MTCC 6937 / GPTSA100-15) TaxID=929562 RepID=A0ABM5MX73_EMTOG|nr:thioredoxin domain-containing protein [Emticicia oligotrophica]AFK01737.1 Thioredoxin domain-containing protein [Emticicia oligotrophica DSM 17448]
MKQKLIVSLILSVLFLSCESQSTKTNLTPIEFAEKVKVLPNASLIDVRTPEEFSKGHLDKAVNIDWRGDSFVQQIANLDKSKPVLVYCLSGGRSAAAALAMRESGFKEVYELEGGIMKWRGENLPETTSSSTTNKSEGLNKSQFEALLNADKLVLVDFYADWCAPCQKMKPYLDEITKEMSSKVKVVRIKADDNLELCKALKIEALPVLQLYKGQKLTWSHEGYIEKAEVVAQINR